MLEMISTFSIAMDAAPVIEMRFAVTHSKYLKTIDSKITLPPVVLSIEKRIWFFSWSRDCIT